MRRGSTQGTRRCWAVVCLLAGLVPAGAQPDYGNRLGTNEADRVSYYASGPLVQQAAFVPALKRWYMPQEIAAEYRWQWEYTNYATDPYRRYFSPRAGRRLFLRPVRALFDQGLAGVRLAAAAADQLWGIGTAQTVRAL